MCVVCSRSGDLTAEGFQTVLRASLSDVLDGEKLATASANVRLWMGVGLLVAPTLGAQLLNVDVRYPYAVSQSMIEK